MYRFANRGPVLVAVALMLLLVSACGIGDDTTPQLRFEAPMNVDSAQRFHVSLGVRNVGEEAFTDDDAFNGMMELTTANGDLVGSMTLATLWRLAPGEAGWPAAFESQLAPGGYHLTWGAADHGAIVVDFTIVELDGWLYLGEERVGATASTGSVDERRYGAFQPLVDLARVNLAQRLGIDAEEVAVVGIDEVEFEDASLGVPEEGRDYAQVVTPGTVIRLVAHGVAYEYHASAERLVFASQPEPVSGPGGSVTIQGVEVVAGEHARVHGVTDLVDDSCIATELYADGERQAWWPAGSCATLTRGEWELVVPLGEGGAPAQLDASVQYMLRAYQRGGPDVGSTFPFDLAGPPEL